MFLGRYLHGRRAGVCWQWQEGGGWLVGRVDQAGQFTGENIAFLFPDLGTGIVGKSVVTTSAVIDLS